MSYPAVPDFPPFPGEANVNLMLGGEHYDRAWNDLEDYLRSLGAYVDEQDEAVKTECKGYTDTKVAELRQYVDEQDEAVKTECKGYTDTKVAELRHLITNLQNDMRGVKAQLEALRTGPTAILPAGIAQTVAPPAIANSNAYPLFNTQIGTDGRCTITSPLLSHLYTLLANLMLTAPNADRNHVLGDVSSRDDLTKDTVKVRSSAALTAAYEAGPVEEKAPGTDAFLTAGELAHVSDRTGTAGPGVFKNKNGWLYVGQPSE